MNIQPQQQEEKKEQSELDQLVGYWSVLHIIYRLTRSHYVPLAVRLFGNLLRYSCAHVAAFSVEGTIFWGRVDLFVFSIVFVVIGLCIPLDCYPPIVS